MKVIPRPEHPRPDFERKAWQNLNGMWEFAIDTAKCGLEKGWQTGKEFPMEIIVPFCPESRLSGIGHTDFLEAVWYRRKFVLDKAMRCRRLLLNFGAVDYEARVWVNGKEVAHHRGGWTPFSADITDSVDMGGENEIVVYAVDDERSNFQPMGKQSQGLKSSGCHYTRTTGIWQTVWLEAVPAEHVSSLTVRTDAFAGQAVVEVGLSSARADLAVEAEASVEGKAVASAKSAQAGLSNLLALSIPDPVLWDVGKPFLYDLAVRVMENGRVIDEVKSYFGLRDVRIEGDKFLLNGESIFQRLVLDQGFWPDGILTAPSDEELRADIERSIACGFNGARLHQKIFEPRTLYWADRLGYLVWGEFPDWGCRVKDNAQARENFLREWTAEVMRDRSHPSLIIWMPLNEAHSKHDRYNPLFFRELYDLTKMLDPSRPVIDTSGYSHVVTDIMDIHDYEQDPAVFKATYDKFAENPGDETLTRRDPEHEVPYAGQPVIVSEYGGAKWSPGEVEGKSWGYGKRPENEKEFIDRFEGLADALLTNPHVAGFCYTQLTDVEQEVNGLYTYERGAKFPPEVFKKILSRRAAIENR